MADEYAELVKQAERAGATVMVAPGGHLKIVSPEGRLVVASRSPSDHKALHNLRAELRRAGILPRRCFALTDEEQAFIDQLVAHGRGLRVHELPPKRLLDKGLVRISRRSKGWMAWLTEKGKQF